MERCKKKKEKLDGKEILMMAELTTETGWDTTPLPYRRLLSCEQS
jgi:hypothetical protein